MNSPVDLTGLLDPGAIAVIGATDSPDRPGRIVFEFLLKSGRMVFPVHPHKQKILGQRAIPRIEELPPDIDLAVLTIGAEKAVDAARRCARQGVRFLIILAGGFSEAGPDGTRLEYQIRQIVEDTGCRILGPNSLGVFVPSSGLDTIFVEHGDRALAGGGKITFISQSGSVGVESLGLASNTGFGLHAFVGLGNKCDLNELDFLRHFGADPSTNCLALYLESLDSGRPFLEQARRVSIDKPVLVLKAGRTPTGASAASSHTGHLAGSDRVITGAFRQYGIQRVVDDEELCDAAKTLSCLPPAGGNRVAVLTAAGGYGVMCADTIEGSAFSGYLQMASLSEKTRERICSLSFDFASCDNPVDLTASAGDEMFGSCMDALLDDEEVDILICIAFFSLPTITDRLIKEISRRVTDSDKPILTFTQYGPFTESYLRRFYEHGVIGFPSIYRTVRAARFLVERAHITTGLSGKRANG